MGCICSSLIHLTLLVFHMLDWGVFPNDKKNVCFCVFLGDNLILWSLSNQKVVSKSSVKSEYRAFATISAEVKWIKSLLTELAMKLKHQSVLYCDDISAKYWSQNPVMHQHTKHVEIDFHFIHEQVIKKEIVVKYCSSDDQLADLLTKPFSS